jgi:hypothetical protein
MKRIEKEKRKGKDEMEGENARQWSAYQAISYHSADSDIPSSLGGWFG